MKKLFVILFAVTLVFGMAGASSAIVTHSIITKPNEFIAGGLAMIDILSPYKIDNDIDTFIDVNNDNDNTPFGPSSIMKYLELVVLSTEYFMYEVNNDDDKGLNVEKNIPDNIIAKEHRIAKEYSKEYNQNNKSNKFTTSKYFQTSAELSLDEYFHKNNQDTNTMHEKNTEDDIVSDNEMTSSRNSRIVFDNEKTLSRNPHIVSDDEMTLSRNSRASSFELNQESSFAKVITTKLFDIINSFKKMLGISQSADEEYL